jgi:hypothetical protein
MIKVQNHRWIRLAFSLRTLFVLVTVFGCWLGTIVYHSQQQKRALEAINSVGGYYYYDYQYVPPEAYYPNAEPPGPTWFWRLVDQDMFFDVVAVGLNSKPATDGILEQVRRLHHLQQLDLAGAPEVTDKGLEHLNSLHRLTYLRLDGTSVSESATDAFSRTHPNVRIEK